MISDLGIEILQTFLQNLTRVSSTERSTTMKFQFKIQGYQTEAVEDTVNVFRGQPKRDPKHYRRDIGKIATGSIFSEEEEAGYRNADVEIDKKQLLDNIRDIQIQNQIVPSTSLSDGPRCGESRHRDGDRYR